eukprot:scaffold1025_cov381-Prasinococcus_capsulatus_cf.AAC.8
MITKAGILEDGLCVRGRWHYSTAPFDCLTVVRVPTGNSSEVASPEVQLGGRKHILPEQRAVPSQAFVRVQKAVSNAAAFTPFPVPARCGRCTELNVGSGTRSQWACACHQETAR